MPVAASRLKTFGRWGLSEPKRFFNAAVVTNGTNSNLKIPFKVLALESSADDTCAAVVSSDRNILSNVVLNQAHRVKEYGGIHPFAAIHEHQRNMPRAVMKALRDANTRVVDIDGIAFTRGPGMPGCLSVCMNAAKTLAAALNKPLVGVHHMQAHALTPILTAETIYEIPRFPFLTLLISGGHTLLLLAFSERRFKILATTVDEAVGRAIDKVARNLQVVSTTQAPGAALEAFCRDGVGVGVGVVAGEGSDGTAALRVPEIALPKIPFKNELKFSFSGLHSVVDRFILEHGAPDPSHHGAKNLLLPDPHRLAIARAFQAAAVKQLEEKVILALQWCAENRETILKQVPDEAAREIASKKIPVRHIIVSGGVASNQFFRQRLQSGVTEKFPGEDLSLVYPPLSLCTDNAAMIAWASMHRFLARDFDEYDIESKPKWSIEELDTL